MTTAIIAVVISKLVMTSMVGPRRKQPWSRPLVCQLVFAGLELLVLYARMGKAMRVVSQNTEACTVVGIDVQQVVVWTFVLGAALAAFAVVLTAPVNVGVYGGMGGLITFKART